MVWTPSLSFLHKDEFLDPIADRDIFLHQHDNEASQLDGLGPTIPSLSRTPSLHSVATVVSHGYLQLELRELCGLINTRRSLADAKILSVECYRQRIGVINHRFLLLHLQREERKDMYLRMDRRAAEGVNLMAFAKASGQTPARDEVCDLPTNGVP